jgi:hypothetical protein
VTIPLLSSILVSGHEKTVMIDAIIKKEIKKIIFFLMSS